jgi:hypothetical protein
MLGVQNKRLVQCADCAAACAPMQQVQEMRGDRVGRCLDSDAPSGGGEMMPIEQHRREARHEAVGNGAGRFRIDRPGATWGAGSGCNVPRSGTAGAQHVHRVRLGRKLLEDRTQRVGQVAQRDKPRTVVGELDRPSAGARG